MLQMLRLRPQTIRMSDKSQSWQRVRSSMPVGQSNQKKTVMVAKTHEDGEEVYKCVNVDSPRSSGSSKKSSSNGLTRNYEEIYSAACRAQSNDGQICI